MLFFRCCARGLHGWYVFAFVLAESEFLVFLSDVFISWSPPVQPRTIEATHLAIPEPRHQIVLFDDT